MGELTHHELEEMLGVYALDAIEPDERIEIEDHLAGCPRCRAELAGHREVAGLFAFAGQAAPAGLWDRITASMQETPPELRLDRIRSAMVTPAMLGGADAPVPISRGRARRSGRTVGMRAFVAAVAAAAALAAVIGVTASRSSHHTPAVAQAAAPAATATMADVTAALHQRGSRRVELTAMTGPGASLDAVVTPSGLSYLYHPDLTPLGLDRTYQLWGLVGDQRVSYGLLTNDPTGVMRFQAGTGLQALAVTDEVASGVVTSHQTPVVSGAVTPSL